MKKVIIYVLLLVSFLLPFNFNVTNANVAVAEEYNSLSIENANFDVSKLVTVMFQKRYIPESWTTGLSSDASYVRCDSTIGYNGNTSIYFLGNTGDITETNLSGQAINVNGSRNYRFGFMAKNGQESNVAVYMKILAYDTNDELVCDYVGETFYTTSEWKEVFVEFTLSAFAVKVIPVICVKGVNNYDSSSKVCYVDAVYGYEKASPCDNFFVTNGASLRLVKDSPGIRFQASIDKQVYDKYAKNYNSVSAGMVLVPTESLENLEDYTIEELEENKILYVLITANKWCNVTTIETDGYYQYYCALVNILPQNIGRSFSARAYVSYEKDGKTFYEYSTYNESVNSRSVKEIAILAQAEIEKYNQEQAKIINNYATFVYQN